jgi:hypothetical protein
MSSHEHVNERKEIPGISEEALIRGNEFTDALLALKRSFDGLDISQDHIPTYQFGPDSRQYIVVIPRLPIQRKLTRIKYDRGPEVYDTTTTSEPAIITSLEIKGLVSHGEDKDLTIVGTSPPWMSGNGYVANSWREEYTFNPLEHQLAIVDENSEI